MISKRFIWRESTKTCVGSTTVSYFGGEEKLQSHLRYSDVLHGSILLSPFFFFFFFYFIHTAWKPKA